MASGWFRAGGVVVRLLFVAVLAVGVVVMHTAGHPDGSSAQAMPAAHAGAMPAAHAGAMHDAPRTAAAAEEHSTAAHGPGSGMDMGSMCLAVLGAWALAGLLRGAFARAGLRPVDLLALAATALRPGPPPHPPDPARLSVLRI